MPDLMPTAAINVVRTHEDLLRGDPDEWPAEPCAVDGPVIYSQSDVWGKPPGCTGPWPPPA